MRNYFKLLLILGFPAIASAQPQNFDVKAVPSELLPGASSVKRYEKVDYIVLGVDKAEMQVHRVITILNPSAASALLFSQYSDKFTSFESADINLYNADGKLLEKYGKKDMRAESSSDGLVDDGKVYYIKLPATSYPVTVEVKYNLKYKGTLFYPDFEVQGPEESVEYTEFTAQVPSDNDLRFKTRHMEIKPVISEEKKLKSYRWVAKNLVAVKDEVRASHYRNRFPVIQTAPNKFGMGGFEGDMSTWKDFGNWMNVLCKGRDELGKDKQLFFNELVKEASTEQDRVRLIYKYMQQNFRYVSIQLGIGGWQPFPADFTEKKKYGDCKALSNYMKSALNAVGIKSHLALINASHNGEPMDPSFPTSRFNHMILCVPMEADSIWLECTSSTADFNVLGSFTENRNALLITDQGGVLVATPASKWKNNHFASHTTVRLAEDGSGESLTRVNVTGEYKEMIDYLMSSENSRRMEMLVKWWEFKSPDNYEFSTLQNNASGFALEASLRKVPDFATSSKMFLSPRLYSISESSLPENRERRLDYYFSFPFVKSDTTVYVLPPGFEPETLPGKRSVKNELGSFESVCNFDKSLSSVTVISTFELFRNRIPASQYSSCRKFINDVLEEHTDKIILKKL